MVTYRSRAPGSHAAHARHRSIISPSHAYLFPTWHWEIWTFGEMNARTLFLSCIALPFALGLAHGQLRRITTHTEPAFLFADSAAGHVHVLTAGLDANFDGIFEADSGGILPRWFVIDAASEKVVDSATFADFFSSFPIRPGVDLNGRRLYVSQLGRIRAYNLDTRALVRDTVINGYFSGVSFDAVANTIVVSERP